MNVYTSSRPRRRTTTGLILVGMMCLLGGLLGGSNVTVAAWQDPTLANGSMTAKTLPLPTGSCAYSNTNGNRIFTFTWTFPPGSGYNLSNVQFMRATSLTNTTLVVLPQAAYTSTGPNTAGNYTTVINANNAAGYFNGMYSDTVAFRLGLRSTENGWFSGTPAVNVRLNASTTAGTCTG